MRAASPLINERTDWQAVRGQFPLSPEYIHLASSQFIASHPRAVDEAIDGYRRELNENPVLVVQENEMSRMQQVREAAANYLDVLPDDVSMTDSTTMGLGLLYNGMFLEKGQEILATYHEYYSHYESLMLAAERTGARVKRIKLYEEAPQVSPGAVVAAVQGAISPATRIVALTWVHSSTGVKLPIREVADMIREVNRQRAPENRVIFCVDGVHGFGIETDTVAGLGCDFLVAGCHKWLYGPRGTGLVAGAAGAWQAIKMRPIIPSFTESMDEWIEGSPIYEPLTGKKMTPGGFHSFEYRWALKEAFAFMESLGRQQVADRVHGLAYQCKQGLSRMPHVKLVTPMDSALSAGIVSFLVEGQSPEETVDRLLKKKIIATVAPYRPAFVRFTPGIYNTPQEVDAALRAVSELRNG